MAVAFDAVSSAGAVGSGATLTWAHTCSGVNRAIGVGVSGVEANDPTGVTYAGVAMTKEASRTLPADADTGSLWELENPALGSNNIVVTFAASHPGIVAGAVSVTGADQTDCTRANAVATGTSTSPSVTVTSAVGDLVFAHIAAYSSVTGTAGTDETERYDRKDGPTSMVAIGYTQDGAASVTINPTLSASNEWGILAMSFRAAPGAAFVARSTVQPSQAVNRASTY